MDADEQGVLLFVCKLQAVFQIGKLLVPRLPVPKHRVLIAGEQHPIAHCFKQLLGFQGYLQIELLFKTARKARSSPVLSAVSRIKDHREIRYLLLDRKDFVCYNRVRHRFVLLKGKKSGDQNKTACSEKSGKTQQQIFRIHWDTHPKKEVLSHNDLRRKDERMMASPRRSIQRICRGKENNT